MGQIASSLRFTILPILSRNNPIPLGGTQEFSDTLRSELDYIREGQSAERFAANFLDDPGIHIPRVFWESTTKRVLTLERIRGTKINDLAGLDAQGIDRPALTEYATNVVLKMVCEDGFFHADPHPGNFFIESDGRIGLIDFGMIGKLDDERDQDWTIAQRCLCGDAHSSSPSSF